MDAEKSSNSSFEDLSNLNEADMKAASEALIDKEKQAAGQVEMKEGGDDKEDNNTGTGEEEDICDVLGNGQLIKRVLKKSKTDKRPQRGDRVTLTFSGKLDDGTLVEHEENFQVHVGDFEVSC